MAYPATVDQLAAELRIAVTPQVTPKLQSCLDASASEIVHAVDRPDDDPIPGDSALAERVQLARGVEWYKANDSAFGVVGYDQTGALQAPRDTFARHARELVPLKRQWGVA